MTAAIAAPASLPSCSPQEAWPKRGDGRYRKQYREFAATTAWGTEEQGCGASVLVRIHDGQVEVRPILCDTWKCGLCGPKRAAWLKREAHRAVFRYKLLWFWTLTLSTKRCSPAESFAVLTGAWNIVRRNLRRDCGPFSYLWVMELTKQGYGHLHMLTSLDFSERELKRRWIHATDGSFQAKILPVTDEGAANYITKYCAEQAHERRKQGNDALWNRKNYHKSQDVRLPCFRCRQVHDVGQTKCATTDDGWYRWRIPYKDATELLGQQMPFATQKLAGTPSAALRAPEGLDIATLCEQIAGDVEIDRAQWQDPEPIVDDPIEELPADLADMTAFLDAMGIHHAPTIP